MGLDQGEQEMGGRGHRDQPSDDLIKDRGKVQTLVMEDVLAGRKPHTDRTEPCRWADSEAGVGIRVLFRCFLL